MESIGFNDFGNVFYFLVMWIKNEILGSWIFVYKLMVLLKYLWLMLYFRVDVMLGVFGGYFWEICGMMCKVWWYVF